MKLVSGNDPLIDSINKIKYKNPEGCIKRCKTLLESKDTKNRFRFYSFIADSYWHLGQADSSIAYYNKAMGAAKAENSPVYIGMSLSNIGYVLFEKSQYNDALTHFFKAIDIYKSIHDTVQFNITQTYIGQVYYYIGRYEDALKIYFPLAEHYKKAKDNFNASISYEMIAHLYKELGENDKAESNYLIALKFAELSKDIKRQSSVKINYADFLMDLKQYAKGEIIILQAIEDLKTISAYGDMAIAYVQLGDYHHQLKQLDKAKMYLFKALEIADKTGRDYTFLECYESLTRIYEDEQNWKEALLYHKKYKTLSDSIGKEATNKELLNLTEKYESDKKDKENVLLQTKNELSEKAVKEQKLISYFIIGGLVIVSFLAFFIFNGLRKQRQANKVISEQKKEVELQKHIIEEHQKETIDSINYAKRIQYALLANNELLKENLKEHFVWFKPKDIVSGDFYWATKHEDKFYLAVCDSTGHGVPGAFMSLLNMGFLSEAIKEKNISKPNEVLNYVRKRLIESIGNDGQQDGMDAILVCLDASSSKKGEEVKITYAAANNEPILIRGNTITSMLKDKMPVGKGEKMDSFTLQSAVLQKGDTLYLYTDGYADQFGGPKGKKFKYKQLNELLLSVSQKPISQQCSVIENSFENWRGALEQVDDICLIGIKV